MRSGKISAFIGGIISFFLIIFSYITISFIFSFSGLKKGQMYIMEQIQGSAQNMVIALAGSIEERDPYNVRNKKNKKYWKKNKSRRLMKMGEAVLGLSDKNSVVEAFFLSVSGNVISSTNFENMNVETGKSAKRNVNEKYNTSFFHRAVILAQKDSSVRVVPKFFPLPANLYTKGKKIKRDTPKESGDKRYISGMALYMVKYIDKSLGSPLIDATSPVFGKDGIIMGTAHYLISLVSLYEFAEAYIENSLKNFFLGLLASILLGILVVIILLYVFNPKGTVLEEEPDRLEIRRRALGGYLAEKSWKDLPPPSLVEDMKTSRYYHKKKYAKGYGMKNKVKAMAKSRMEHHDELIGDKQEKISARDRAYYRDLKYGRDKIEDDAYSREEERLRRALRDKQREIDDLKRIASPSASPSASPVRDNDSSIVKEGRGKEMDLDDIPEAIPVIRK